MQIFYALTLLNNNVERKVSNETKNAFGNELPT